ncbi:MAG: hypothetical protein AAF367_11315 [Pseudomonadota bacterium]
MKKAAKSTSRSYHVETSGPNAVLALLASHYHADVLEPLGEALKDADARSRSGIVIVDLSAVVLLSSTALRALRAAHIALEARGGRIVAAGGGELVVSVLKFAPFIAHYPDLSEAAAAFRTGAAQ